MSDLSKKSIQEMKDLLEKESGKEITWEEATEASHNLTGLAELLLDSYLEDERRKNRLKESPKGFCLDGVGYSCFICGTSTPENCNWYDKWGIKCLTCQKAIDKKIIPASCAKNKESWYSKYDLESRFSIDRHAMNRFIKRGVLKPRIVPSENGKPYSYLFLVKDNKDTLPPKKLTESQMVKEEKDGKEWHRSYPWHCFVKDPHEELKGYKIMDHLQVVKKENDV